MMRGNLSTHARVVSDKQASVIRVSGIEPVRTIGSLSCLALVLKSYTVMNVLVESADTGIVSAV